MITFPSGQNLNIDLNVESFAKMVDSRIFMVDELIDEEVCKRRKLKRFVGDFDCQTCRRRSCIPPCSAMWAGWLPNRWRHLGSFERRKLVCYCSELTQDLRFLHFELQETFRFSQLGRLSLLENERVVERIHVDQEPLVVLEEDLNVLARNIEWIETNGIFRTTWNCKMSTKNFDSQFSQKFTDDGAGFTCIQRDNASETTRSTSN